MTSKAITQLIHKLNTGDKEVLDLIYSSMYSEIKAVARNMISQLKTGETITPTVMAHECYEKMLKQSKVTLVDRRHFLNYLAKSMRMLLIDVMRAKSSIKRQHFTLTQNYTFIEGEKDVALEMIDIDLLLQKIERINPSYHELLQFKLIYGFTFKEISELINLSPRQVMRQWKDAITLATALSKE